MKRIIYIHQYFKTPKEGGAIRSYHIAKGMVDNGYSVEMITTHNQKNYEQNDIEGIKVHYLPIPYSNDFGVIGRIIAFLRFVKQASQLIKQLDRPDLIYATSTPLTVGMIALRVKRKLGIPYIFEVRDLWPEAPIQLGILRFRPLISKLKRLEKKIYEQATAIVALSPGILEHILQIETAAEVVLIPNMADTSFFQQEKVVDKSKPFTIGYFGAFGYANNTDFLLEIAKTCEDAGLDVHFLFAGEGAYFNDLKGKIANFGLNNIRMFEQQDRATVRKLMREVDACITSFLPNEILDTTSPNKFFDGLATGKLSIVTTQGWLKEIVEQERCGFRIDATKPTDFPRLIKPFMEDDVKLQEFQSNARRIAEERFSREVLVNRLIGFIDSALSKNQ